MNFKKSKRGFTLVELIVVITILTILWTIGFISIQGYTLNLRDSVRITDLKNIKSAIELARIEQWRYIYPDSGTGITYSWSILVWTQWVFWKQAQRKTKILDEVPLDPLTQDEYTFSVTSNNSEFELWAILEWNDFVYNQWIPNILTSTYAATSYRAFINGTYNGKIVRSSSWGLDYIFAVPSIINGDITLTDIEEIIEKKKLVVKWYWNLPSSYNNQDNGALPENHNFVNEDHLIVFEWNLNDLKWSINTDEQITIDAQAQFISNIQSAYSGTTISWKTPISSIFENNWTPQFLAQTLIKESIDKKIQITAVNHQNTTGSSSWWSNASDFSNCLSMTEENVDNLNTAFVDEEDYYWYYGLSQPLEKTQWCDLTEIIFTQFDWQIPIEIWFLNNLEELSLTAWDINEEKVIPSSIWNLINLNNLVLNWMSITSLPSTIWNLTNLENLSIEGNSGLWNINASFDSFSNELCWIWLPQDWKKICIGWNWTTIDIEVKDDVCSWMTDAEVSRLNTSMSEQEFRFSLWDSEGEIDSLNLTKSEWCNLSSLKIEWTDTYEWGWGFEFPSEFDNVLSAWLNVEMGLDHIWPIGLYSPSFFDYWSQIWINPLFLWWQAFTQDLTDFYSLGESRWEIVYISNYTDDTNFSTTIDNLSKYNIKELYFYNTSAQLPLSITEFTNLQQLDLSWVLNWWALKRDFNSTSTTKVCDTVGPESANICIQYFGGVLNITIE